MRSDKTIESFDTEELEASEHSENGYYCDASQYQYVDARTDRIIDETLGLLRIGAAGADGILFVMKPRDAAIYAYYPYEYSCEKLAQSFSRFISGWKDGTIAV